jgi:hypothetical protein
MVPGMGDRGLIPKPMHQMQHCTADTRTDDANEGQEQG